MSGVRRVCFDCRRPVDAYGHLREWLHRCESQGRREPYVPLTRCPACGGPLVEVQPRQAGRRAGR